jgi:REP element-mobilizing transposase RayT
MPRKPRLHVDGGHYHVILRGNHRQSIFFNAADRLAFAELVAENIERFGMRVHAFCWMSNHVHLLMQVGAFPLARAMMRIASRFARGMQRNQQTTGHFFERRYRAILVDADVPASYATPQTMRGALIAAIWDWIPFPGSQLILSCPCSPAR